MPLVSPSPFRSGTAAREAAVKDIGHTRVEGEGVYRGPFVYAAHAYTGSQNTGVQVGETVTKHTQARQRSGNGWRGVRDTPASPKVIYRGLQEVEAQGGHVLYIDSAVPGRFF